MLAVSATIHVPSLIILAVPDVDRNIVLLGEFNRARLQHRRAEPRQLQHLIVTDPGDLAGIFHDPRVGSKDPVHIRVILADFRLQHRPDRHQRRIAAATPQSRVISLGRYALKSRDDDDLAASS